MISLDSLDLDRMPLMLKRLWADIQRGDLGLQVLIIVGALLLAYGLSVWIRRRLKRESGEQALLASDSQRLLFPFFASLVFFLVDWAIHDDERWHFMRLAGLLTNWLFAVRLAVLMLKRGFERFFEGHHQFAALQRFIEVVIWGALALHLTGLLQQLVAMSEAMIIPIGKNKITLLSLLQGSLTVLVTLMVAFWLGAMLEGKLMRADAFSISVRAVVVRVMRALIAVVAVLLSLQAAGLDLTMLSVFSGALGVGLGFGMQRIASNYVSGFIILLEGSVRIGQMIAVDKFTGTVTQIKTRFTVVKLSDGTEAILPNELLISAPVSNFAYSDQRVRFSTRVQVAYGSPVKKVAEILQTIALAQPRVIQDPPPTANLIELANDGLLFELAFWVVDPEEGSMALRSAIHMAVLEAFEREAIEIPFTQRVVRLQNA